MNSALCVDVKRKLKRYEPNNFAKVSKCMTEAFRPGSYIIDYLECFGLVDCKPANNSAQDMKKDCLKAGSVDALSMKAEVLSANYCS